MHRIIALVLSLNLFVNLSVSQILQNGQCEDLNISPDPVYDLDDLVNTVWYEVLRTPNGYRGDCSTITFTKDTDEDNTTITINNIAFNKNFREEFNLTATQAGPARFLVNVSLSSEPVELVILRLIESTAVGYSCINAGSTQRNIYIWTLSTETFHSSLILNLINSILLPIDTNLNTSQLESIAHSDQACYELPVIEPGEPIILPGACDPDLSVVQDFQPAAFMGEWHQLYNYYTENTLGSCARAEYSLSDGVVQVLNSEVQNQQLLTISGSATLIGENGSAKLNVSLEVAPGVNVYQSLWVLATDYDNYAVLYSCENLPNNTRRVYSWISSKSRLLSNTTEAAIEQVVDSYLDLNFRYYAETNRTDHGCFYYPEPSSEQPIVFRGTCDKSIPVQPSFDAARYLGVWYNIESYPSLYQFGTCKTALYTLNAEKGVVEVYNTQIVNETLEFAHGVAAPDPNGEAKLVVSFPIVGTNLTAVTDYWVLTTDYDSYALVYTCVDLPNERREVYGWKLGREKVLSATANTTINNIMSNIPVLDQRYYITEDQSEEGCFYYPEPEQDVVVVFPGQCDNSTPAVSSFNMTAFQGVWYEIEAYPKEQQTGQCVAHEYTTEPSNDALSLISSSVIDQFLSETAGRATYESTDGSGRLEIQIEANNETIRFPFWILSTDYTDYALAYSCINLNSTFKGVWSWKLSRTKQLSNNAVTNIGTTVSEIEVLDDKYYHPIDQSDRACFYLPELEPGEPVVLVGQCDENIAVVENFDAARYLGVWRTVESYHSDFTFGECHDAEYTLSGDTVIVYNTQVIDQELYTITGNATFTVNATIAKLDVMFPGANETSNYWVLDTDYDTYSLVYSCANLDSERRRVWSWKLSRTGELSIAAQTAIDRVINEIEVLNNRYFTSVDQSDAACFYYPEPNGQPVVFRGRCDNNVNVVNNFQAAEYQGLWYNTESYPNVHQTGTCNTALYTLNADESAFEVYNTQVLNETLAFVHGVAVLDPSGEAKFVVTIPNAGTNSSAQSDYWVLATDYYSYSLVYICVDLPNERRQVYSWKLGREKVLSTTAIAAINNTINNIPVLDQRYYEPRDHSEEGCFYYPKPEQDVIVVFPGQCDNSIQAVSSFNMTAFQGVWYEIEAYPKEQQTGQCVAHKYTTEPSNDALSLISSSVIDQFLSETAGRATYESTDGSGRLEIQIETNNETIRFPFWILSTDYTDYALAYSCINLNSTFKGVWSWKLSRTKQLSNNAVTNIGTTVSEIEVLDDRYYHPIDQSDRACFYLPELEPGESVVFVGQCDENIAVVENFDAARYLGVWRTVETYHSDFTFGECHDAEYTLSGDTVIVYNTQVIDQELYTITGNATFTVNATVAKLDVMFPGANETSNYWVLDTDYDTYSLVYSCANLDSERRRVWSWKLSRTGELSIAAQTAIDRVINEIEVLNNRYFTSVDQSDAACFYYPEPNGQPVVFRGRCDNNVNVVNNFQAAEYQGLWYNTESYPNVHQTGTCNTALYTLNADESAFEVYNTQVLNETLAFVHGVAVLDPSGEAKFVVTIPNAGTNSSAESDYWVLATDYYSYSLVYICVDLPNERRQVSSYKLGREKVLSTTAIAAINNTINNIPVLDQRYYEPRDHSEEGCFYYPEPEQDVIVVFPGQCDNSIQAVSSFNMTAFQGVWYEIEAYPKEQQTGQCVAHKYTTEPSNDALSLISSSVIDQFLSETAGRATYESTDGSGRLEIQIETNNETIRFPFWILSTDYTDYALAYSCINLNSTFKGVWSWKLSRTKQLSNNAVTNIGTTVSEIEVLDDRYYHPIDQSDRACFYLPELEPGESVVFVGQCDENIAVVENFDAARYLGVWRTVETYHSDFTFGECHDAEYTLSGDTVIVYNTQVIDQELYTITGNATFTVNATVAKLDVMFPGANETSNYWVLDTDYDTYSLVYSCANLDSERRRVWSWKLSRTGELSIAAQTAIDRVINEIEVLNNRYFTSVDQSDAACFYYPEPNGQPVVFRGRCDNNVNVVNNFQAAEYQGLWYNTESYPNVHQTGTCNTALYTLNADESAFEVYNTQVLNETLAFVHGVAVLDPSGEAKFVVTIPNAGTNSSAQSDYWVLATDYYSYSLVYICVDLPNERRQVSSYKLGREKVLSTTAIAAINNTINNIPVLDQRYYEPRDHSEEGCFYYPEPEQDVVVVFPGQCDNSIQAVSSFNMTAFQGVWYEIEAYPKEQQTGQCVAHKYTTEPSNDALSLISSSVIDQFLSETAGRATYESTDGSGRLEIQIETNNETIRFPFWILSTDYTDYALAYSCINLNSTFRGVWSWKLSRTKQLSNNAVTNIGTTVSEIEVLDDRYYHPIDQSDRACFYLPELEPGEPVVLVGQCDENIPVVENFDAARYLGRWRTIQAYASEFQNGDCQDAQYSLSTDAVIVYNTQVINQSLDTITGSATFTVDATVAKLDVSFPGTNETSTYWVLGTDYDSYALVYSCRNINSETRRVWSWILSRTDELNTTAMNAINEIIESINVLDDRYYSYIDQSDDACFYYPEPNGQPVVFRGKCDESIPVVTGFDVERYLGLWYDIESYPQTFQMGSCPTANYTLGPEGVIVYNTQVVDERLDEIYGLATLATDDGSAKLDVTFPIAGTNFNITTPYWVLATDYDSYSFVYSCSNIDDEYRRVSAWKLSRDQTLSETSQGVITNISNSIPVLRQQYYDEKDHNSEGCFFYPENFGGPVILSGVCEANQDVVANFNSAQFSGTWYEVSRFPSELQSGGCVNNEFTVSGNTISIEQTAVDDEKLNSLLASGTLAADGRGIIETTFSNGGENVTLNLHILSTDYSGYALLFSCRNLGNDEKQIYSWKLSRSRAGLSTETDNIINGIVDSNVDLYFGYYEETDQSDLGCFYYPVFDELPSAIEMPGPCSVHDVRPKPNFQAANFAGRWFEIARYPQPSQVGECAQARYSLDGAIAFDVVSTTVYNQTLNTIPGRAVSASTDGSAVYTVTFNFEDGSSSVADYYILETDYTNFALLYTCRDLSNGNSEVSSWKLSRARSLSNQANAAINQVINNTRGLLDDYYRQTSQSDEACFYIPEFNPDQAPVFRGQCSDITAGVENFDAARYLGWWHEIERYPSDTEMGECISSRYEQAVSQYQVVDISVSGVTAQTNTSLLEISANGRLRKFVDGNPVDIWVLATDYENYALLFSCETIDSEYIRVWSAKHSKSRQLSNESQQVMSQVIANNQYLQADFYLNVNQSDDACFHYPDPTGGPVVLPGQCDPNIPTMQDFSVTEYTGRWYQIEKYPQIHESGTCIGAEYTLDEANGVVLVLNWEVINGELITIEGTGAVVSEDGSAVLNVTLPIVGTEDMVSMELRVLTTDYVSHSLVYSCVNIDEFYRQVGAWKLSRTRTLPSAANSAINTYMAQREELDQRYFVETDQNDECLEPSAALWLRSSFIAILICIGLQLIF